MAQLTRRLFAPQSDSVRAVFGEEDTRFGVTTVRAISPNARMTTTIASGRLEINGESASDALRVSFNFNRDTAKPEEALELMEHWAEYRELSQKIVVGLAGSLS